MHPAITSQIVSDMHDRRIRRAADHALAGPRPGLFTAVRARLTARRTAAAARPAVARAGTG